jgi:hypothetical protein
MADLTEFREPTRPKAKCLVFRSLEQLNPEDREAMLEALETPDITHTAITRFFLKRDLSVSARRVCAHRNLECSCV